MEKIRKHQHQMSEKKQKIKQDRILFQKSKQEARRKLKEKLEKMFFIIFFLFFVEIIKSEQNHENEIKLMFEQQAEKERYLEKKKQEAERLRQQLDQMDDDKHYSQMQKLSQKSLNN